MTVYAAILAGGVGTRLWPRSRQSQPKQFADITGDGQTMIQDTLARLDGMVTPDDVYILTGERYRELTTQQLPTVPAANVLVEPSGRNTAPGHRAGVPPPAAARPGRRGRHSARRPRDRLRGSCAPGRAGQGGGRGGVGLHRHPGH
ncbi:MAG: sugar phosphate nucleotidyltransferase [Caldilineaceae bacterium]